jgi:1,4-dihydroxy-2-naphthoate octaprenyltransferase
MQKEHPPLLKTWIIAVRPFALSASTMPVIFGTVTAVFIGGAAFNPLLFVLSFLAMVILHSGANLLSDVNDYRKGLDKIPTPVSGAIVRGYISPESGLRGSIVLIAVGVAIGLVIVYLVGVPILIIGIIGVAIGVLYTVQPIALKYHALGDLAVFLDFGILGAQGAWTVQTKTASWIPALWAVPMAMLVVAILHANNWRDIRSDEKSDVKTVAALLGDRGSYIYYGFLVPGAFGVVVLLLVLTRLIDPFKPELPLSFLIIFCTFPMAVKLMYRGKRRKSAEGEHSFITLDAGTSLLNLLFGLLSTGAVLLQALLTRWTS